MATVKRLLEVMAIRCVTSLVTFWPPVKSFRFGEQGNAFQRELIEPATLRLAAPGSGKQILDNACGAGRIARLMAAEGAQVMGIDFCATFEEPGFQTPSDRYFEWQNMPDLTPVLVCRLKEGRRKGGLHTQG